MDRNAFRRILDQGVLRSDCAGKLGEAEDPDPSLRAGAQGICASKPLARERKQIPARDGQEAGRLVGGYKRFRVHGITVS